MPTIGAKRVPLWLKIAWTVWVLVWAPVYWKQYGAQNFLYFCDVGNVLITIGLWLESPLILSWQAVGLLVFQTLYTVDLVGAALLGKHAIGGTEYMFDTKIPILIRLMGLYHIFVPPLLIWCVRRLGYDQRALSFQIGTTAILVPICYLWRPAFNVNWARGIGHEQHLIPGWLYVVGYVAVASIVVYWPTHVLLKRWGADREQVARQRLA